MKSSGLNGSNVVALSVVLLLLVAVLLPQFLKADTVSDVALQRIYLNVVATGLEAYAIDEDQLPPWFLAWDPPPAVPANALFPAEYLTTPVDYVAGQIEAFTNVLTHSRGPQWYLLQGTTGVTCTFGAPYRVASGCFPADFSSRSQEFMNCAEFDGLIDPVHAYMLWGAGPDGFTIPAPPCSGMLPSFAPYDPTNGLVSNGQIYHFGYLPATAHTEEWRHYR